MAELFQKFDLIADQGQFLGSAPAFELAFTLECQRGREWAFNIDQSYTSMIPGKFRALRSTVFLETFWYVAGAPDVNGVVPAGEDVHKSVPAYRRWRFSCGEVGKIV
jgi:hypothetical protein